MSTANGMWASGNLPALVSLLPSAGDVPMNEKPTGYTDMGYMGTSNLAQQVAMANDPHVYPNDVRYANTVASMPTESFTSGAVMNTMLEPTTPVSYPSVMPTGLHIGTGTAVVIGAGLSMYMKSYIPLGIALAYAYYMYQSNPFKGQGAI